MLRLLVLCLLILFDSYFIQRFHAKSPVCTNFTSSTISLEELDTYVATFGSHPGTIEDFLSEEIIQSFAPVFDQPCLINEKCEFTEECVKTVREKYHDQITNTMEKYNVTADLVDKEDFINYKNPEINGSIAGMNALFGSLCMQFCFYQSLKEDNTTYQCYCPQPCSIQTACPKENCVNIGVFEHQYYCNCKVGAYWDGQIYACLVHDLYVIRNTDPNKAKTAYFGCFDTSKCYWQGTKICLQNIIGDRVTCVCRPQFKGQFCNETRDACSDLISGPYLLGTPMVMAGDVACNVNVDRNVCHAFISAEADVSYHCYCNEDLWGPDPELGFDNCLKRRHMCLSIVCEHGRCVTNNNGTQPRCICFPGYEGDGCTEWVGEWSQWSPWDKCTPACGDVRYTVRTRDCISLLNNSGNHLSCRGSSMEFARCEEHPCARADFPFINSYFSIRQTAIASSIAAAAVACAVVAVLWTTFCWSIVSRIVYVFALKLQSKRNRSAAQRERNSPGKKERKKRKRKSSD